ncbi:hypothetical protein NL676_038206 [Syzygium grande]|nr:hypothetical protein NL676_038206 [Syzygium grande]
MHSQVTLLTDSVFFMGLGHALCQLKGVGQEMTAARAGVAIHDAVDTSAQAWTEARRTYVPCLLNSQGECGYEPMTIPKEIQDVLLKYESIMFD